MDMQKKWSVFIICILIFLLVSILCMKVFVYPENICNNQQNNTSNSFPQILHHLWKHKNVPTNYKEIAETCKEMYPHYKYNLWTDEDMVPFFKKNYPWFLPTFEKYPYNIQRVDAFKYFLVYHFGGIYIDMDAECLKPFDPLLDELKASSPYVHTILRNTNPSGKSADMLIGKPRNPFFEFMIHHLQETAHSYILPYITVMFSTGPEFLAWSYRYYPCKAEILILDQNTPYYKHHEHSSWQEWDGKIIGLIHRPTFMRKLILVVYEYPFTATISVGLLVYIIIYLKKIYLKK